MSTHMRVKEKSAWKTVAIPEDLLNSDIFDGLVDIQTLTDYDLVEEELESGDEKKPKKRKRKKNKSIESDEPVNKITKTETSQSNNTQRKSSGLNSEWLIEKKETNDILNLEENDESVNTVKRTKNQKKKRKSKKKSATLEEDRGAFVSSKGVDTVTDVIKDVVGETASSEQSKTSEAKSKRKKKRRKKKKTSESADGKTEPAEVESNITKANDSEEDIQDNDVNEEKNDIDMSEWANLCVPDVLMKALTKLRFDKPTVIQTMALPSAIRDRRDILGAAETGSGKTLAFGIPVLSKILSVKEKQNVETENIDITMEDEDDGEEEDTGEISNSQERYSATWDDSLLVKAYDKAVSAIKLPNTSSPPLALILEPTRELANQVKKHMQAVASFTDIKFAIIVGGMSIEKQRRILAKKPEVIIATPGRLWQLIEEDNDHLKKIDMVHCLVVDEADRMVEKGHYEELTKLLELMNKSSRRMKRRQTFVMSATLTMDIDAPKRLNNKKKKIVTDDKLKSLTERICVGMKPKVIDLTPKDKVAQTLTELRVNCKADEKDFYLYYFLCEHPGRTLVFANSKDCLRRLNSLFTLLQRSPLPLHADMHQRQRLKNLDKFAEDDKGLLIASDVAARGLDIPKVDHVIHYQVPRTMENYVHRSGRTARASNLGLSVMLVAPDEARDYRKIVQGVRNGEDLPVMPVDIDLIPAVKMRVQIARNIDVKEYRIKKKKMKNNFFTKAAEDMDMIIDDRNLLEDLGDDMEQIQDKHEVKAMRASLTTALKGSLAPLRMSKYPTKSGMLSTKKTVNLLAAH